MLMCFSHLVCTLLAMHSPSRNSRSCKKLMPPGDETCKSLRRFKFSTLWWARRQHEQAHPVLQAPLLTLMQSCCPGVPQQHTCTLYLSRNLLQQQLLLLLLLSCCFLSFPILSFLLLSTHCSQSHQPRRALHCSLACCCCCWCWCGAGHGPPMRFLHLNLLLLLLLLLCRSLDLLLLCCAHARHLLPTHHTLHQQGRHSRQLAAPRCSKSLDTSVTTT
mmetsp:Transcript_10237/g.26693  ORF Transcript_10237/g.26693 Transcript_10237/m.26693 type:complete len:218 (+) Transcript_10237:314-967(+)